MSLAHNQAGSRAANLTVAIGQHASTPNAIDQSLARIGNLANEASDEADLLLLPEASLTGYNMSLSTAKSVAVSRNSNTTENIQAICQRFRIALAYGYIERDEQSLFNAVHVIDSSGDSVAHYRKCHLWGELDRRLFTAGNRFSPVFTLLGWQLGLLICYDIEFPETARQLSLEGAELIIVPTALMQPWTFVAKHMTRVRAAENQVYIAYANFCGSEQDVNYVGLSCIVGPDGNDVARADSKPALIQATLDKQSIDDIRTRLPYHRDRRSELYRLS